VKCSSRGAIVGSAAILALGCVDHHYEHTIRGRVVDPTGAPVAMAQVCPVRTTGMPEDFGMYAKVHYLNDRVCVQSGADGRFEFHDSGLGPPPGVSTRWNLLAMHRDWDPGHASVTAIWLDSFGYAAEGIEIALGGEVPVVPFEEWICAVAKHVRELHGLEVACPKPRRR
jgi:hypothetical protein